MINKYLSKATISKKENAHRTPIMSVTSPSGREGSPTSLAASISGGMKDLGPLVGAIDQGTGSTRFLVFAANTAELVTCELMTNIQRSIVVLQ